MSHHKARIKSGKDGTNGERGCRGKRGHRGEMGPQGPPGKNASSTLLQTQYALVQTAEIPRNAEMLVVSLPITMTSLANGGKGILEILATFSFTAIEQTGAEVRWRLSIDNGPTLLAASQNAPAVSTSGSGSMVFSTKAAPLSPGPHTIQLFASPAGGAIALTPGTNHAAIFAQETTN